MCSHDLNLPFATSPTGSEHAGAPPFTALPTPSDAVPHLADRRKNNRRKLWDVPGEYHCPIIGTCLHVEELRQIARKARSSLEPRSSDYQLHVRFVAAADEKNPLSIAAQKLLEKKHAGAIRQLARAKDEDQLLALWREAVASGQVPGAFWALMTHPKADARTRGQAYQDVHMLSHQVGAGLIADARMLAQTRAELASIRKEAREEAQRSRAALDQRDKRIASLEGQLTHVKELENELSGARRTIAELQSDGLLAGLREGLARLETQAENLRQSEARANRHAALWRDRFEERQKTLEQTIAELEEHRATIVVLERLLEADLGSDAGCECCSTDRCTSCPDLTGRRVLCIGGRSSLTCHYRSLVERYNGELIHHDGGLEDSRQRLDSLLCAADVVVCPADCVSHDAYLKAKRYCKRTAKPCVLLKSSGVASFAQALEQVAA